jgi:hypothetical protein
LALDQSMYSVESAVDQNSRSSSSLLNVGISFRVEAIDFSLAHIHIPNSAERDLTLRGFAYAHFA